MIIVTSLHPVQDNLLIILINVFSFTLVLLLILNLNFIQVSELIRVRSLCEFCRLIHVNMDGLLALVRGRDQPGA